MLPGALKREIIVDLGLIGTEFLYGDMVNFLEINSGDGN